MKRFILFFTALFTGLFSYAQLPQKWSLAQCVEYALSNNLTIKQTGLNLALSEENVLQSRLSLLPSLNASASQNYNFGRSVDPLTYEFVNQRIENTNFGLNSSITVFGGFQRLNGISQSNYQLLADKSNLEKVKNDISLAVITAYLQVLYNQDLVSISKAQVDVSKLQVNRAEKNFEVGNLTKGDLMEIKAQLAREELNLTNAQNQLDLSKLSLIQLLDLDPANAFEVERPVEIQLPLEDEYSSQQVYSTAVNTLPDIKLADYTFKAARKGLAVARGGLSPRITLNGGINSGSSSGRTSLVSNTFDGYRPFGVTQTSGDTVLIPSFVQHFEKTPFRDQLDQNRNSYISFNLTIPLFNGWQTRSQVKRAKINMQTAELNSQITRNNLNKTITQAVADHQAGQKKYLSAKNSYESLKEAFTYNEKKFEAGLLNSADFNISKNNMARAEAEFLQAKYDLVFRSKILDFYLGKPLTF